VTSAEASVLAWFSGVDPPIGLDDFDNEKLVQALMVIWPEYMGKMHNASIAIIDNKSKLMQEPNFANRQMSREYKFETIAYKRSMIRIRRDLKAIMNTDKNEIKARISQIIKREKRFSNLRMASMIKRLDDSIQYENLRLDDPRTDFAGGALWQLDESKETHTADCLIMAGKVWSWNVLRYVNPANRHAGCGCTLKKDPSLVHGLESQSNSPIGVVPQGVEVGWDMGTLPARPMPDVKYQVPSFNDIFRSL